HRGTTWAKQRLFRSSYWPRGVGGLKTPVKKVNHRERKGAPGGAPLGAALLPGREEVHVLLHCLIDLVGREQNGDSRFHAAAGLRDQRDGGHLHVAGQVDDDVKVVAAESEVEGLQLTAHIADHLVDHRRAFGTAFLEQALQALFRVGTLTEILGHVILLVRTRCSVCSPDARCDQRAATSTIALAKASGAS